jgi:hypothetical protein
MPQPDAKQQRITYTDRVKSIDKLMSMKIEVKDNKKMIYASGTNIYCK